jgi:hypothetical protein
LVFEPTNHVRFFFFIPLWFFSQAIQAEIWIPSDASEILVPENTPLYHWASSRRRDRLLDGKSEQVLDADRFKNSIRPRPEALLGGGLYLSPDPGIYAPYGETLIVVTLTRPLRLLKVSKTQLRGFIDPKLKTMGLTLGIRDPGFQLLLKSAGYDGVQTDAIASGHEQCVIFDGDPSLHVHEGNQYLKRLSNSIASNGMLEGYATAISKLQLDDLNRNLTIQLQKMNSSDSKIKRILSTVKDGKFHIKAGTISSRIKAAIETWTRKVMPPQVAESFQNAACVCCAALSLIGGAQK